MSDLSKLGRIVAQAAFDTVMADKPAFDQKVMGAVLDSVSGPAGAIAVMQITPEQVQTAASKALTQDPAFQSKRLWAAIIPALSTAAYALLDPSVITAFYAWLQSHPGAWWGVAANVVAILLPLASRLLDPRPVRGKP